MFLSSFSLITLFFFAEGCKESSCLQLFFFSFDEQEVGAGGDAM